MWICTAHHRKLASNALGRFPYVGPDLPSATHQPTRLVYYAMCLYTHKLSLVLTVPTHGGMAQAE